MKGRGWTGSHGKHGKGPDSFVDVSWRVIRTLSITDQDRNQQEILVEVL